MTDLSPAEKAICYRLGISEDAYRAQRAREQAAAGEATKPPSQADVEKIRRQAGVTEEQFAETWNQEQARSGK